jgi:KDO2-lipid IV(A) lauroyltransferase
MLVFLFRLLSLLPLRWLHGLGRLLGRLVYALPGRYRERLRRNAARAGYADARFAREAAAESGASMLELAWIWFRTDAALARVHAPNMHLAVSAQQAGRPVLFLTPHLGGFEISARYAARHNPITVLYRPPRQALLARLVEGARATSRVRTAPAALNGVRQLVRALRNGAWAAFFGHPAYTMTLPARLARQPGTLVLGAVCERLPAGRGWHLHIEPITEPIPQAAEDQAAWVNNTMERLIRRRPQQYLWSYNRYKKP